MGLHVRSCTACIRRTQKKKKQKTGAHREVLSYQGHFKSNMCRPLTWKGIITSKHHHSHRRMLSLRPDLEEKLIHKWQRQMRRKTQRRAVTTQNSKIIHFSGCLMRVYLLGVDTVLCGNVFHTHRNVRNKIDLHYLSWFQTETSIRADKSQINLL